LSLTTSLNLFFYSPNFFTCVKNCWNIHEALCILCVIFWKKISKEIYAWLWNQPTCQTTNKWIKKMWYIRT
jgi:hypothetical protein